MNCIWQRLNVQVEMSKTRRTVWDPGVVDAFAWPVVAFRRRRWFMRTTQHDGRPSVSPRHSGTAATSFFSFAAAVIETEKCRPQRRLMRHPSSVRPPARRSWDATRRCGGPFYRRRPSWSSSETCDDTATTTTTTTTELNDEKRPARRHGRA